jgi:uncharacterized protein (DUF58 family)
VSKSLAFFLIFILAFFVLFFPSWIIQAVALLLFLTLVLCYIYASMGFSYVVAVRRDTILRAHRLQKLVVTIDVENRVFLPIHFVFAQDTPGALFADKPPNFFFGLGPWERRRISYTIESRERGDFEVGPFIIRGADPLGLFPWEKQAEGFTKIIIYPRVLPIQLIHRAGLPAGNIRSENKIYEDITRYRSLKEYTPGDDTRRINWKVSARLGNLYCMEYLPALSFPVLILLNLTTDDFPVKYRSYWIERSVEVAASLCYYFIGIGQEVGLVTSGVLPSEPQTQAGEGSYHSVSIKSSYGHAVTLLECLARIRKGSVDFTRILFATGTRIPLGTRIPVVSPPLRTEQITFLEMVKRKGYNVELFQIAHSPEHRAASRRFPCHQITDYGEELIEQGLVSIL